MQIFSQLPFPRINKPSEKHELTDDLMLEAWIVPKGTTVLLKQTTNFGWCIIPEGTKDKRDFIIPKRIFQY